ncbi:MAG: hypothetical protein IJ678_09100, partial [Kiritimatiellae bacterium]|nr:hypothetical protein [Kiritimatiellia bacterium]
ALAVFAFGLAAALAAAFAVMAIERPAGGGAFPLLFEAVSAYSNNGLSLGSTTASLSVASRLVLCAAMFAGRLGPATLAWTLAGDGSLADRSKRYPEENVVIG